MSRRGSGDSQASSASYRSAQSDASIQSYYSILSDDSYIVKLKPIDKAFREMCEEIRILDTGRNILEERKQQSHDAKKRDPRDTTRRYWPPAQVAEYNVYKSLVDRIKPLRAAHEAAIATIRNSRNMDLAVMEAARRTAMTAEDGWAEAAMAAATSRITFLTKYPGAFSTPSNQKHIKAAEDNLNSAKAAKKEIQIQTTKIAEARALAQRRAARN